MSIFGAMVAGVSGLSAQSQALGMISDNIANMNTVGYKGVTANFATLVTQAAGSSTHTPGGVMSNTLQKIDQQGLLQSTNSATDIALAGNGFLVVNGASDPTTGEYLFTRAGSFLPDEEGNLVNTGGYYLQGWPLDSSGNLPANTSVLGSTETINVSNLSGVATPTQVMSMGLNLPSAALVGDTHSATVQIYDSLGNAHNLELQFEKTATNAWDINVQDPTLSNTGAVSGTVTPVARSITFNGDGTPATVNFPPVDITGWTTGAIDANISGDLGVAGGTTGVTQFAGSFSVAYINQDGLTFGNFSGLSINEFGMVTALFDNGEQLAVYQLPIAIFANPNGLIPRDGNAYTQSDDSGQVLLNPANVSGAARIANSALEASNVDLAEEFTKMIVTQRAYSASAKIITTADDLLEELIRIRR